MLLNVQHDFVFGLRRIPSVSGLLQRVIEVGPVCFVAGRNVDRLAEEFPDLAQTCSSRSELAETVHGISFTYEYPTAMVPP